MMELELILLREEMNNLKNCQVTFLTIAVTGTALLLALASGATPNTPFGKVCYLPLVILIPAWWIFFEKAKTISRIVGYLRVIEMLNFGPRGKNKFVGWENAQAKYRKFERDGKLQKPNDEDLKTNWSKFWDLLRCNASPYWMLTYSIFFALTISCSGLGVSYSIQTYSHQITSLLLVSLVIIIVVGSSIRNFLFIWHLVWGRYSYESNEYYWKKILGII